MTPVEAFDLIVRITGITKLSREGHERVKVALMVLRPLVEQTQHNEQVIHEKNVG